MSAANWGIRGGGLIFFFVAEMSTKFCVQKKTRRFAFATTTLRSQAH